MGPEPFTIHSISFSTMSLLDWIFFSDAMVSGGRTMLGTCFESRLRYCDARTWYYWQHRAMNTPSPTSTSRVRIYLQKVWRSQYLHPVSLDLHPCMTLCSTAPFFLSSFFDSKDTVEWGSLFVGCAGGGESLITMVLEEDDQKAADAAGYESYRQEGKVEVSYTSDRREQNQDQIRDSLFCSIMFYYVLLCSIMFYCVLLCSIVLFCVVMRHLMQSSMFSENIWKIRF